MQNPGLAYGGEKFVFQPAVQVVDSTGLLQNTFVGSAYVFMGSSPSGYEKLFIITDPASIGCNAEGFCGTDVIGTVASVPVIQGIANFEV